MKLGVAVSIMLGIGGVVLALAVLGTQGAPGGGSDWATVGQAVGPVAVLIAFIGLIAAVVLKR